MKKKKERKERRKKRKPSPFFFFFHFRLSQKRMTAAIPINPGNFDMLHRDVKGESLFHNSQDWQKFPLYPSHSDPSIATWSAARGFVIYLLCRGGL